MTNPYDPNQGSWQGGPNQAGGQPDYGRGPGYGQQQGQPSFGWQPGDQGQFGQGGQPPTRAFPAGQPPVQGLPADQGQYGWQPPGPPQGPPPGQGGWGPAGPGGEPPRSRATLWVSLSVVLLLVAAGVVTWLVLANKSDNTADGGSTSTASMTPPAPPSSDATTEQSTTEQSTTAPSTTEQSTTEQSTTAESTTEQSTSADPTTEQSTTEQSTTEQPTTEQPTTGRSTSPASTIAADVKVKVGDCVAIANAQKVDLNESGVACTDPSAVYRITVIGASKSECDKNEANWQGTRGGLIGKTLCLLPNLKQGDCFRTGKAAANGDYEKIPCAKAAAGDTRVAYASTTTADGSKCAKNTTPYDFPKRKVLLCFAKVG
jgi:hypothetical protein